MPVLNNKFRYLAGFCLCLLTLWHGVSHAQNVRFIDANPESVGLTTSAELGLPDTIWQGTTPQRLAATLIALPDRVSSPAQFRALVALLGIDAPPPPGDASVPSLASLRVSALARLGDTEGALKLAAKVSPSLQQAPLLLAQLSIKLMRYDLAGTCNLALRASDAAATAEWQRVRGFCLLLHGQEESAMVAAILADELPAASTADSRIFSPLFLAKQFPTRVPKTPVVPGDLLDLVMLRALNIKMAAPEMANVTPTLAAGIALSPASGLEIRTAAAERAVASNALPATVLIQLYLATELTTPLGTLYKQMAYAQDVPARLKAVAAFWDGAEKAGLYAQLAPNSLGYLNGVDPASAPDEFVARAMRTAMVAGDTASLGIWRDAMLARALLSKGAEARNRSYAILALAGEPVPPVDTWWQAWLTAAKPNKSQIALTAGLLKTLGIPVPKVVGPPADKTSAAMAIAEAPFGEAALLAITALNQKDKVSDGLRVQAADAVARLNRTLARAVAVELAIAAGI
jgi:hypothetical protein